MQRVALPPRLAPRPLDAHKASVGKVLVVGGSRDMCGAPALAALGALRAGAGLVRVAVPRSIQGVVASIRPEATTTGLADEDGALAAEAEAGVEAMLPEWDTLVLGPGAGRAAPTRALLASLASTARPLVLDADGLFALGGDLERLAESAGAAILTPHEGEAARLLATTSADVRRDRESAAVGIAKRARAVAVLKGPGTVVTDGERVFVCTAGTPALASGGTGDVLAGVAGAFLAGLPAAGTDAFGAASAAVHVHARAGEIAAAGRDRGALAADVAHALPEAIAELVGGAATS